MIIETRNLLKTYELGGQTIRALDGVSIGIDSGEMVAIMGPSGSGKSTLMHILGCLDQSDGGQYLLRGDNIAGLSPDELAAIRNKYISFVFQTFNLLPRMSAQENVALPLLYGGAKDANARAADALARVGLADRMHHEPNQLSGGQRQRVAIARAIVTDPTLMLADEPTGNLDSRTGDEIMELFAALNREGRTIIVVTHEPDIAVRCPRCIRIHDGKVLSDGPSARDSRELRGEDLIPMNAFMLLKIAIRSLLANKLRSFLAVLGIIIGVGAVIAMLSIGAGARESMVSRLESMGTNLLMVRPGQRSGPGGVRSTMQQTLMPEDAKAILSVENVFSVAPVVQTRAQVKYYDENANINVLGTSTTYFATRNYQVEKGRKFTDGELDNLARVAIIGPATAKNLMAADDPLSATIKVNGMNFRVIGVTAAKGDQGWYNPDDQVIIPYTTCMQVLMGSIHLNEIDIQGETGADLAKIQEDIIELLRLRHKLEPETPNDFNISNQAEMLSFMTAITTTLSVLLASIGGISLVVGGIGIMNIMLVTVTERTREIGIRKAIGAREGDIMRQFLFESIVMSTIGGVIGVMVGVGVSSLLPFVADIYPIVQPQSVALSISFATAIGVFFGFYPARRAARLNPIDALRYE